MSDINITGTVSTSQDYTNSYRNQMQESLIDAINILYKGAVAKENISKTLECVISDASERDKGIYKVDYMKNIFEVSCPLSTVYDVGDAVFVLVPDGDFSKTKIIVGSAEGNTGGSSGADVEANPAGTATDTLEKLRVGTTIYSIEGGPADAVTDVKVNGTSVVGPDHVARVSAVTQAQLENALETKADANDLSALEGTVSDLTTTVNEKASQSSLEALATIVGTKANAADVNAALNLKADQSDLSDLITVVNGKANISDIPEIEANPSDTATDTLTKIDIDGTVYDLAGGTTVIANPSGSATDELEKVQIGNTIYSLPLGGGAVETIIPTTKHATSERNSTAQDTYTATDDMYAIAVNLSINGEASSYTQTCSIATDGEVLDAVTNHQDTQSSPNRNYAIAVDSLNLTSGDDIDFINTGTATYIVRLRGVVGLNQEVRIKNEIDNLIVSDNTNNSRTVTLSPDKVYMVLAFGTSGNGGTAGDINVTSTGTMAFTTLSAQSAKMICAFIVAGSSVTISFGNDSNYYSKGHIIYEVDVKKVEYATKEELENYVVANPEDAPTDDISSIKIGDTVYNISGGSSTNYGKFKCDVLFVNNPLPSPTSGTANVTRNYTLNKSIDDYDAVYVVMYGYYYSSQGSTNILSRIVFKNDYYLKGFDNLSYYDGIVDPNRMRRINFTFTDSTHIQTMAFRSEDSVEPMLYKVYGLKFENKLINRSDIYSEEERMIGRWTDGKPLYQKTYKNLGINLPASTWTPTGITFSDIDYYKVISNKSYLSNSQSQYPMLYRYYQGTFQAFCQWQMPLDELTIQYTKITDTPDSGVIPEDPMFISDPMIYSEDEQVVGSWIDGKPLYQKTGHLVMTGNTSDWTILDNSDIYDYLVESFGTYYEINGTNKDYMPHYGGRTSEPRLCVKKDHKLYYYYNSYPGNNRTFVYDYTIQYTKTTDAPGTGPTKGNLIYLPALYSEEEREVGVWTDGKPLYQKTYITDNVANGYQIDVSGLSIDKLIDKSGTFRRYRANSYLEQFDSIDWRTESSNLNDYGVTCKYAKSSNLLVFYVGGYSDSVITTYVTIQYTKTTDQPGSGTWTPEGQLAHHYSTSEKVVGTWIDGSTVYEITVNKGSVAPSGSLVMDRKTMLMNDVLTYLKIPTNSLLYYTNQSDVIWEVKAENYGTDTAWNDLVISGSGGSPSIIQQDNKDTLDIPFGTVGTYTLPDTTGDKTLYTVLRMDSTQVSGDYGGLIGFMYADNQQNTPMFMIRNDNTNTIYRAVYGASWDYNTGKSGLIDHVLVISIDSTNKIAKFFVDGESMGQAPYGNYGDLRLGARLAGQSTNVGVKYIGVTKTFDSNDTIINNTKSIVNYYGI